MLLAIDPSKAPARTGWAIFDDHTLVACGHESPSRAWLDGVTQAIIERPRIYPHGRTPNPQDIVTLAWHAAQLVGALYVCGVLVREVEPADWKHGLDKAICCRRVWGRLREDEQYVAARFKPEPKGEIKGGKDHVLDAIGIGLHALGRFSR